ncbi:hypothetical protein GUJ93_ZPchr0001g30133 [Zizania palustris]|uniref:Uncharacterized protein n=1 Tax=Zizania palustris TaxID=103762 RepID=A0A8J5VRE7_ZIZPA|nr:hypothetical protein GUJ93_ZPchr0001g30133 [Zizania palustris]
MVGRLGGAGGRSGRAKRRNWARRRTWHGGARRKPSHAKPFVAPNPSLCGNLGERRGGTRRGEGPGMVAHGGNLGHAKPFIAPNPSLCRNLGPPEPPVVHRRANPLAAPSPQAAVDADNAPCVEQGRVG